MFGTVTPLLEAKLAFTEEQLSSGLELIEDVFGKHLAWYTQESNTKVVFTEGAASFLVQ